MLNVGLPESTFERLREIARSEDRSTASIIRIFLQRHLDTLDKT